MITVIKKWRKTKIIVAIFWEYSNKKKANKSLFSEQKPTIMSWMWVHDYSSFSLFHFILLYIVLCEINLLSHAFFPYNLHYLISFYILDFFIQFLTMLVFFENFELFFIHYNYVKYYFVPFFYQCFFYFRVNCVSEEIFVLDIFSCIILLPYLSCWLINFTRESMNPFSYKLKSLTHLSHQFLLSLVRHRNIFNESREMCRTISCQDERISRLTQKINKVPIVPWWDVWQSEKGHN